ncbi:MAG: hypothetical protein VB140_03530 [Burkholderia sp.]|nr:MAG: hypothetical protein E5299_00035 [Burkholderia gladioli]
MLRDIRKTCEPNARYGVSNWSAYKALLHKSSVRTQWNGLRTTLVRNPFISPEIMPVDAIASSHSIYATTP